MHTTNKFFVRNWYPKRFRTQKKGTQRLASVAVRGSELALKNYLDYCKYVFYVNNS